MEQDKRVEDKKARFILLITQVVLWFMVMVMEMVVLIVKQINVSEHMLFLVSINLITIVTILINVHNYHLAIPSLLAVSALHQHLVATKKRRVIADNRITNW